MSSVTYDIDHNVSIQGITYRVAQSEKDKADATDFYFEVFLRGKQIFWLPGKNYHTFCAQHLYITFPKYDLLRLYITDCLTNNKTKSARHNETVI